MRRFLSLGAGVQSTTLALMAAHGEIEAPDCAIFADTQWEPRAVYEHLAWLRSDNILPFPVHIVTRSNIRESIRLRRDLWGGTFASIPWHLTLPNGTGTIGQRQCTSQYKLEPIRREIRRLLGKGPRDHITRQAVEMLIGISRDEAHRMRDSKVRYITNRYPLIELGMRRYDCLLWLRRRGYPEPPKSSCIGCPLLGNDRWRQIRQVPDEWDDAVQADREIRHSNRPGYLQFMHHSRAPLDQVDLSVDDRQLDLFGNECEGMCGV